MVTESQRVKAIGTSLRFERRQHGFTQRTLADAIGRNQSTIHAWEGNGGAIGLKEAWQLADLYDITLDKLAGRDVTHDDVADADL